MRIYINSLFTVIALALLASCSKSTMDEINENHNNPENVSSKFTLTDVMTSSAFKVTGSDYAFYASVYMELNVGVNGQMFNAEMRTGEPTASSTYNNTWGSQYENLYELKIVRQKCSPTGPESGNYTNLGIAQVLTAYNLAILTDLMGDVPYSEALQPGVVFQPKIDKQQVLYDSIFQYLDSAIVNLQRTYTCANNYLIDKQDLIYPNDVTKTVAVNEAARKVKWLKVAYGLRARYKMRLSLKTPDYQGVIDDINKAYANTSEDFKYNYNGASSVNPFYSFKGDRPNYLCASQSLHNKLVARNDPRDNVFFTVKLFGANGNVVESQKCGVSAISNAKNPTYLQSYHELQFLMAEAYARLNNKTNAETALKNAIMAAFAKVGLTASAANTYYTSSVKSLFDANPLQEIMNQKYLAFYEDEGIEAYNDYRRLKAMGNDFILLENPLNAQTKFPWRFTYGADDVSANQNVKKAYGDGTYVYSEQVWWAGGTK